MDTNKHRWEKVEKGCWRALEGGFWRKMVVLNYTYLHEFTAFYHLFLGGNVTGINEAELTTETPRHRAKRSLEPMGAVEREHEKT
jgi:hypothetical protein